MCGHQHFKMRKEMGVMLDSELWYDHVPKLLDTGHEVKPTILWNQKVQTDRTIRNNKPDIIFRDSKKGICVLADVAIRGDRNVIKREAEISKYKDLIIEIERMWNGKTKVIPVIKWATGTISKSLRKYLSNVTGKRDVQELNKTATLGTARTAESNGVQYKVFIVGESITCAIYCNNRVASTLCSVGKCFVLGV